MSTCLLGCLAAAGGLHRAEPGRQPIRRQRRLPSVRRLGRPTRPAVESAGCGELAGRQRSTSISVAALAMPSDAVVVSRVTSRLGGTTTTYMIPSSTLPLLQPLQQLGVPERTVDALNSVLKPIVDAGYSTLTPDADRTSPTDDFWACQQCSRSPATAAKRRRRRYREPPADVARLASPARASNSLRGATDSAPARQTEAQRSGAPSRSVAKSAPRGAPRPKPVESAGS